MTNPGDFYSGQDKWRVARDPSQPAQDQPVVFQSIAMPGEDKAAFSITWPFVPASNTEAGREILRGLLAVDADAGSEAGRPAEDYGSLRLLELGSTTPAGPAQVLNQIQNSPVRSQNPAEQLSLAQYITNNSQSGKELTFGNLLTFPLEGRMFYVQPIYVQAASGSGSFPQNKINVAVYGTTVAWGDTLEQAVSGLFGTEEPRGQPAGTRRAGRAQEPPAPGGSAAAQLAAALNEIQKAYAAGQEALKAGDFAAYGVAQQRLDAAIKRAQAIAPQLIPDAASPSPSPSPARRQPRHPVRLPPAEPPTVDDEATRHGPRPGSSRRVARTSIGVASSRRGADLARNGWVTYARAIPSAVLRSRDSLDAGWSSSVARRAHNPEVAGSNPAPATRWRSDRLQPVGPLLCRRGTVAQVLRHPRPAAVHRVDRLARAP